MTWKRPLGSTYTYASDDPDWQPAKVAMEEMKLRRCGLTSSGQLIRLYKTGKIRARIYQRKTNYQPKGTRKSGNLLYNIPDLIAWLEREPPDGPESKVGRARIAAEREAMRADGWIRRADSHTVLGVTRERLRQLLNKHKIEQRKAGRIIWLREADVIALRDREKRWANPPKYDWPALLPQIEALLAEGLFLGQIADKLGVGYNSVRLYAWKHDMKRTRISRAEKAIGPLTAYATREGISMAEAKRRIWRAGMAALGLTPAQPEEA